jgi:DNA-binding response OmpR family regulator
MDLEDIGANDYIGKKFKPDHLVKRIRRLLGSKD